MSDDLIKRSDVLGYISRLNGCGLGKVKTLEYIRKYVERLPSADRPSAVDLSSVYSTAYKSGYEKGKADRPQGEWIIEIDVNGNTYGRCSICGMRQYAGQLNYCPNCGARMKGADDE